MPFLVISTAVEGEKVEVGLMLKWNKAELCKEHSVMETRLLSVLPAQGCC